MSEYYFPDQHSAEEWREMANECGRREQESWERCDNDGFLSQWASGQSQRMYHHLAGLAENGGKAQLPWLFYRDGERVEEWRWVKGRYGASVFIPGAGFFNESHARDKAQRLQRDMAKGYVWGVVEVEVVCRFGGSSYALSIIDEPKRGAEIQVIHPVDPDRYGLEAVEA